MEYVLNWLYSEKIRLQNEIDDELEKDQKCWLVIIEAESKLREIIKALDILEQF